MQSVGEARDVVDSAVCDSGVVLSDTVSQSQLPLTVAESQFSPTQHTPTHHDVNAPASRGDDAVAMTTDAKSRRHQQLLQLFDVDDDGDTKLMLAVVNGDDSAVHYLVALAYICGSTHLLDIRDTQYGLTALHLAVGADRPSIVRLLVVAGASPNIRSRRAETALLIASARRLAHCISALMRPVTDTDRARMHKYCSDVKLPVRTTPPPTLCLPDTDLLDCQGRSCLHLVQSWKSNAEIAAQRIDVIDFLINRCGANVNIQEGSGGLTLLHLAVKQRDHELFTYLLHQRSVDMNALTYGHRTALDLATADRQTTMADRLQAAGARHSPYFRHQSASSSLSSSSSSSDDSLP